MQDTGDTGSDHGADQTEEALDERRAARRPTRPVTALQASTREARIGAVTRVAWAHRSEPTGDGSNAEESVCAAKVSVGGVGAPAGPLGATAKAKEAPPLSRQLPTRQAQPMSMLRWVATPRDTGRHRDDGMTGRDTPISTDKDGRAGRGDGHAPVALRQRRTQPELPRETHGLGRCPSCCAFDGPGADAQLGADDDGQEAADLRACGHVHIAPVDAAVAAGEGGAWTGAVTAESVVTRMGGLIGNANVLEREPGDLIIWLVNPAGNTRPYNQGGKYQQNCRLATGVPIVESGVADIMLFVEAHATTDGAKAAARYVSRHFKKGSRVLSAPTSRPAATMELSLDKDPIKTSTYSGILAVLAPDIAARLVGTPDHRHFVAGRLLHFQLAFPQGVLNVIVIYGVSSPASTARKVWTAEALAGELRRVIHTLCGNGAKVVMGDMNAVKDAGDRSSGRLQSYDDNPHAPWRVLQDSSLIDLWRYKLPDVDAHSYVKDGQPLSRIDQCWVDQGLINWGGGDGGGTRIAMTVKTEPLSPDHRSLILRLQPHFTRAAGGEGLCTAISAAPKPVRSAMNEDQAFEYGWETAKPGRQLAEKGRELGAAVDGWPAKRRALDAFGLDTAYTGERLEEAARKAGAELIEPPPGVVEKRDMLRLLLDGEDRADLGGPCTQARVATSEYMHYATGHYNEALGAARGALSGKTRKEHVQKQPTIDRRTVHRLIRLVALATSVSGDDEKTRLRREAGRQAGKVQVLLQPPPPAAGDEKWAAWGAVAMPHALGILAQAGSSNRAGVEINPPESPSAAHGSLRLGLEQMLEAMGPAESGGAVDALLAEFDPETGALMPCFTHTGLSKLVRNTVEGWSSDKAYGAKAYAYTNAMTKAIFDDEIDARGMRRSTTGGKEETRQRVDAKTSELRRLAGECRRLQDRGDHATQLGDILRRAEEQLIGATAAEKAAVKYMGGTPGEQQAAAMEWNSYGD